MVIFGYKGLRAPITCPFISTLISCSSPLLVAPNVVFSVFVVSIVVALDAIQRVDAS